MDQPILCQDIKWDRALCPIKTPARTPVQLCLKVVTSYPALVSISGSEPQTRFSGSKKYKILRKCMRMLKIAGRLHFVPEFTGFVKITKLDGANQIISFKDQT